MLKTDNGWHDYLMSKLVDGEKVDGVPTCPGLLRVFEEVYGKIFHIDAEVLKTPSVNDRSATVKVSVHYYPYPATKNEETGEFNYEPTDIKLADHERLYIVSSSADIFKEDLNSPFDQHLVSSAETRALGRALKRALNVKGVTLEEISGVKKEGQKKQDDSAPSAKIDTIKWLCEKAGVDVDGFYASQANISTDMAAFVSSNTAEKLIETLNAWGNDKSKIPAELKIKKEE